MNGALLSTTLHIEKLPEQAQLAKSAVPVLALGSGLTLNGVIRSFGRAKLPVYGVCPTRDFAAYSRWYRELPLAGASALKPIELETFLRILPLDEAVLMPCSDDWLQAVVSLPVSLTRRFRSSLPPGEVVHTMLNKWRFAQLLVRTGTLHPRTILLHSPEELHAVPEMNFGARIFKPLSSMEFAAKHGVKGYLAQDRAEALRLAPELEYPIMLQEYIPGPPTESYFIDGFIDQQGRICARFARRRVRMYPHGLGNSSLTASISLCEVGDAATILDHLFDAVAYRGIFSAEFKHDCRDGLFKILEVNARPWWYVEFAARCGVDVCRMAYADALGLPVESVHEYEVGRRCVFLPHDIRAYRDLHRQHSLNLWSWSRSLVGADGALFSWDDPGPAIAFARDFGKSRLRGADRRSKAA
jgi:predicted ATP-grasp superfamily ATP-dependent carboligase